MSHFVTHCHNWQIPFKFAIFGGVVADSPVIAYMLILLLLHYIMHVHAIMLHIACVYVCACACVCVSTCVCACVCVCMCTCVYYLHRLFENCILAPL